MTTTINFNCMNDVNEISKKQLAEKNDNKFQDANISSKNQ